MKNQEEILKSFAAAEEEQRLQLFMAYRELREEFAEIERRQPGSVEIFSFQKRVAPMASGKPDVCRRLQLCWRVLRGQQL